MLRRLSLVLKWNRPIVTRVMHPPFQVVAQAAPPAVSSEESTSPPASSGVSSLSASDPSDEQEGMGEEEGGMITEVLFILMQACALGIARCSRTMLHLQLPHATWTCTLCSIFVALTKFFP